jgi:16S rRNA A1518/A1519 N6-dimethyltransferase RsmA/KsgA/DIM1 with predicted DNA glycosylase/AP lyase activity
MDKKKFYEILNKISKDCNEDNSGFITQEKKHKNVVTIYGELLPQSVTQILDRLNVKKNDVFYDLGSGTGRICLQVYLEKDIKCTGIEYVKPRHDIAEKSLDLLKKQYKNTRKIKFINGDFFDTDWSDATIIYICNTCMGKTITNKILKKIKDLQKLKYVFTVSELPSTKFLNLKETMKAPTSWSEDTYAYIYEKI